MFWPRLASYIRSLLVLFENTVAERAKILVLSFGKGVVGVPVGRAMNEYFSAPEAVESPIGLGDDVYRRGHLRDSISCTFFFSVKNTFQAPTSLTVSPKLAT
ncbi:hypothetical protein BGX38DRAFT_1274522 [Terfezia claveryi]|nr:hypothetical protein BGX38DRAFT_1274522 [Terfezia claveryi]